MPEDQPAVDRDTALLLACEAVEQGEAELASAKAAVVKAESQLSAAEDARDAATDHLVERRDRLAELDATPQEVEDAQAHLAERRELNASIEDVRNRRRITRAQAGHAAGSGEAGTT